MDRVLQLIKKEEKRQRDTLMMIPSENYTYPEVRKAVGSSLMQKYSEGQVGARYYQGNEYIDEIEALCKTRALELFKLDPKIWGVNVQALSGSPANLAIMNALLEPGDTILSMYLYDGGHLSHGWQYRGKKISLTSKIFNIEFYKVDPKTGKFNYDEIRSIAKKVKPKLIISGGTAYASEIDHKRLSQIAHDARAFYLADVSHEAGLIAGGVNKSPFREGADIVMMTTHKTLRGPRGALIFSRRELSDSIDQSVFPGIQGGPHNNTIAGIAIALEKAKSLSFKKYALQTVINARFLADELKEKGYTIVSGGTQKHLILVDLRSKGVSGWFVGWALEYAGIIVNKSTVPADPASPYYPSGLRLGTPALTARGMREKEMKKIANLIDRVINEIGEPLMPQDKDKRLIYLKKFKKTMRGNATIQKVKEEIKKITKNFPVEK
jgi:glycine hydroxymethyltransferase